MADDGIARFVGTGLAGLGAVTAGVVALFVLFVGADCDQSTATCVSGVDYLGGTQTGYAALQLVAGIGFLALAAVVLRAASTAHVPTIAGATLVVAAFVVAARSTIGALGLVPLVLLAIALVLLTVDRLRDRSPAESADG